MMFMNSKQETSAGLFVMGIYQIYQLYQFALAVCPTM